MTLRFWFFALFGHFLIRLRTNRRRFVTIVFSWKCDKWLEIPMRIISSLWYTWSLLCTWCFWNWLKKWLFLPTEDDFSKNFETFFRFFSIRSDDFPSCLHRGVLSLVRHKSEKHDCTDRLNWMSSWSRVQCLTTYCTFLRGPLWLLRSPNRRWIMARWKA